MSQHLTKSCVPGQPRSLTLLLVLTLTTLCACMETRPMSAPKLADIEKKSVSLQTSTIAPDSTQNTLIRYQHLLNDTQDSQTRQAIQRRIADLTVLSTEEDLAEQTPSPQTIQNLQQAATLYENMLKDHSTEKNKAEIYYQLARLYELMGQTEQMQKALDQLITRYPASPYVTEAQFRRAEYFFSAKHFHTAAEAYRKVLARNNDPRFYEQSLYKLGWSHYKSNNYSTALPAFLTLLEHLENSFVSGNTPSSVQHALLSDTYRAASLSFAHLDGAQSIEVFFNTHGKRFYEYKIYESLSRHYLQQERYNDAASTLEHFVNTHPLDAHAPAFQTAAINALRSGGFDSLALAATERYITYFGMHSPFWSQYHAAESSPEQQKTADTLNTELKTHLTTLSTHYHRVAQTSGNSEDYQRAAHWYRLLLDTFPDDAQSLLTRQLLAESLLNAHLYTDAIRQFEQIATNTQTTPKDAADSRYATVLIYEKQVATLPMDSAERAPLLQLKTAAAAQFYTQHPNDKRAPAVLNNSLNTLVQLGQNLESVKVAQQITQLKPDVSTASAQLNAWIILGNSYFDAGEFQQAEHAFERAWYLSTDKNKRVTLEENRALAIYKQAGQMQKNAQNNAQKIAAAQHYARIGQQLPQTKIRPDADFAAAVIYLETQQWSTAIAALDDFRMRFPLNPLNETVPDKLALAYEKTAQWPLAAKELEHINQRYHTSDPELARQALWKAALLQEKTPDIAATINNYTRYAQSYPRPIDTLLEAQFKLSQLYAKNHAIEKQLFWLNAMKQSHHPSAAEATARMRYLVAYGNYKIARIYHQRADKIRLSQPLTQSIKAKKNALDIAMRAYNDTLEMGETRFVSAASYQRAELYRQFAQDLLDSERPGNLNTEALEQYQLLLEEQALPIEDKAIALYQQSTNLVTQHVYDRWVKKSYARLRTLLPARYAKDEKLENDIDVPL